MDVEEDVVREGGQKVLFPRVVTLIGAKAVLAKYQQVSTLLSDGEGAAVSMADLQPLKTYGWVLSEAQVEHVRKWLGIVAARLGGGFGEACIQDKADGGHASASVAAGGSKFRFELGCFLVCSSCHEEGKDRRG